MKGRRIPELPQPLGRSGDFKFRLTVGAMMVVVAASAAGLGLYDHLQRPRLVLVNNSGRAIPSVTLNDSERFVEIGPVGPHERVDRRVRLDLSRGWRMMLGSAPPHEGVDRREGFSTTAPVRPGGTVQVDYDPGAIHLSIDGRPES